MSVISNLFLTLLLVNSAFSQEYEGDVCKVSKNNVKWTCKSLETCESALRKLKTERPEVCSFSGFNVIVCCEPKSSPTSTEQSSSVTAGITPSITPVTVTENPTRAKPTGLKSEQKCREYAKFVYQKPSQVALSVNIPDEDYDNDDKENTCSISKVPLIVDGSPVSPREFPHQVIIGYQYGSKTKWACAGSLISENFVLSAAHCSKTPFGRPRYAKIGDLDTSTNTDDAKPETLNIVEIFDHPSYLTDFPYNDIALYKLEKNVSIDGYKRPACLNTKRNIQENKAVATGWGNIEYGGVSSQHLLKVSLDLIANKNCSTFWRSGGSLNRGIDDEQMICAGDLVGKKDTCQALLGYEGNNGIEWLCGGILISENYVLTAAHCIKTKRTSKIGSPKVVLLGERNYESRTDKPQEIGIAKIIIHPDYAKTRPYNDIALIKLGRNFTVNSYSRPACLLSNKAINTDKVIATGWGSTENGGTTSKELLKVELNLIDNDKCNYFYSDLPNGVDETMICAGDLSGRKDTCRGDSGGPLQVKLSDPYCMYGIIGVTSLGRYNKCGTKQPSIFTRVSDYLPWIEKIVWP